MPDIYLIESAVRRFYIDDIVALNKLGARLFNWEI
jgi:hypothetical protein